ncbi:MAG: ribbon-helix-helix domain-containing protein [Pseudomonadota bacterium]
MTQPNSPISSRPPSRVGKKAVTAYVSSDLHKRLRMLGLEIEKSSQEMLTEALLDYLEKHTG